MSHSTRAYKWVPILGMREVGANVLKAAQIHMHNHQKGEFIVKLAETGLPL